ncbi:MAG: 16S rRNA (adenine(1518)-N(6)/adenine(1519)-N(6))-dimethyltransferase RsmA [Saprospiraceae bacterium]|nr:16S rRNA (adenine(1518)-N(6)/adenine(1519)-N(6))-dimethyltransferase RsmA [Saprospiraceae bacterium]
MGRAKKRFGQHFLTQEDVAKRIVDALPTVSPAESVLEVGPGRGMLTQFLLKNHSTLYFVEADRDMIPLLHERFPLIGSRLIQADFLKLDLHTLPKFHMIGNFPYNISSQILFKVLDNREQVPTMVGMFQKEVAERIVAKSGSRTYGILSVLTQAFYSCEYMFTVEPSAFTPPPKVQSGIIRLIRDDTKQMNRARERFFRRVVKMAFNQRRKMLRNSLKALLEEYAVNDQSLLSMRPEQLTVQQFVDLADYMNANKINVT